MDRPVRNTRLDSNSRDPNAASVSVKVFDTDVYSQDAAGRNTEHTRRLHLLLLYGVNTVT